MTIIEKRVRSHYTSFSHLFLYITQHCQLKCRHCYMGDRLCSPIQMSCDVIENTLRRSKNLGANVVTIIGGEPIHPKYSGDRCSPKEAKSPHLEACLCQSTKVLRLPSRPL